MALERIRLQFFYRNERTNDLLKIIRVYLLFLKDIFTHEIIKLFLLYVRAKHCNTNCNRYRLFLFSFPPFCSLYLSLFIYSTSFLSLFRLIITAFFFLFSSTSATGGNRIRVRPSFLRLLLSLLSNYRVSTVSFFLFSHTWLHLKNK